MSEEVTFGSRKVWEIMPPRFVTLPIFSRSQGHAEIQIDPAQVAVVAPAAGVENRAEVTVGGQTFRSTLTVDEVLELVQP